jgi:hypothetical protein
MAVNVALGCRGRRPPAAVGGAAAQVLGEAALIGAGMLVVLLAGRCTCRGAS